MSGFCYLSIMIQLISMDDLNNRQMILLTMLVSFVVSIATGIITVAMLNEAPQTLTQTVNRVVERTIERVTQASSTQATSPSVTSVTKEVTVYAKEEDLLVSAIEKNDSRVVVVYPAGAATSTAPLGIGFLVSRDGVIAVPSHTFYVDNPNATSYLVDVSGKRYTANYVATSASGITSPVAFLKIVAAGDTSFDSVTFSLKTEMHQGQTVALIGGAMGDAVFKTTISRLVYGDDKTATASTSQKILLSIEVDPKIPEKNDGGLVINLDGQLVGMSVWVESQSQYVVYPSSRIFDLINSASKTQVSNNASDSSNSTAS